MRIYLKEKPKAILYQSRLYVKYKNEWYEFYKPTNKWLLNHHEPINKGPIIVDILEMLKHGRQTRVTRKDLENRDWVSPVEEDYRTLDEILESL